MRLVQRYCSDELFGEYSDVEDDTDDRPNPYGYRASVNIYDYFKSFGITDWTWDEVLQRIEWLIETFGAEEISGYRSEWTTLDIPDGATDYRLIRDSYGEVLDVLYVVDGKIHRLGLGGLY